MPRAETHTTADTGVFREVNSRIREVAAGWTPTDVAEFVCECLRPDCVHPLRLMIAEYDAVRADPARRLVVPGHEEADEHVVAAGEGYVVVVKDEH
jgi:hypothetical protein